MVLPNCCPGLYWFYSVIILKYLLKSVKQVERTKYVKDFLRAVYAAFMSQKIVVECVWIENQALINCTSFKKLNLSQINHQMVTYIIIY